MENYTVFEYRASEAVSVLEAYPDSRLVVDYLCFLAKVFGSPQKTVDELSKDAAFTSLKLKNSANTVSAKHLMWSSEKIDTLLAKRTNPKSEKYIGEKKSLLVSEAKSALSR